MGKLGSVACVGFCGGDWYLCSGGGGLDLVFLVGRAASDGVFWGVCELSMILGSLSVNGWGCVPVLLVVWYGVYSTGAAGSWVELGLSIETEISGRVLWSPMS